MKIRSTTVQVTDNSPISFNAMLCKCVGLWAARSNFHLLFFAKRKLLNHFIIKNKTKWE